MILLVIAKSRSRVWFIDMYAFLASGLTCCKASPTAPNKSLLPPITKGILLLLIQAPTFILSLSSKSDIYGLG